jgi:hypothetical protein
VFVAPPLVGAPLAALALAFGLAAVLPAGRPLLPLAGLALLALPLVSSLQHAGAQPNHWTVVCSPCRVRLPELGHDDIVLARVELAATARGCRAR